jgi:hypothetical protein
VTIANLPLSERVRRRLRSRLMTQVLIAEQTGVDRKSLNRFLTHMPPNDRVLSDTIDKLVRWLDEQDRIDYEMKEGPH